MAEISEVGRFGLQIWLPKNLEIVTNDDGDVLRINLPYPMDDIVFYFTEETISVNEFMSELLKTFAEMVKKQAMKKFAETQP